MISKARGETDLPLDDFVNKLDPKTRAAAEKAANPGSTRSRGRRRKLFAGAHEGWPNAMVEDT